MGTRVTWIPMRGKWQYSVLWANHKQATADALSYASSIAERCSYLDIQTDAPDTLPYFTRRRVRYVNGEKLVSIQAEPWRIK